MAKPSNIQADLNDVLAQLPQAEKELEAFLAGEIVSAQNKGSKDMEAIARYGKTAALATLVSWKKVMLLVAEYLDKATTKQGITGVNPLSIPDLEKLGGLVNRSIANLTSMKLKADVKAEQEILTDKTSVITRIFNSIEKKNQFKDGRQDFVDRKKLGVDKDGTPEKED